MSHTSTANPAIKKSVCQKLMYMLIILPSCQRHLNTEELFKPKVAVFLNMIRKSSYQWQFKEAFDDNMTFYSEDGYF